MTSPSKTASVAPSLLLSVAALLVLSIPALAQTDDSPYFLNNNAVLFEDEDRSGGASCGEQVSVGVIFGAEEPGAQNLTNLRVELQLPTHVTLLPERSLVAASRSSTCTLVEGDSPGDTRLVAECSFLCVTSLEDCDSQVNGGMGGRVVIDDPNPFSSLTTVSTMTADQITGSISRSLTIDYEPCPAETPPDPAALDATKTDRLVDDVDGDGRADAGDTVRYEVTVSSIGGVTADGVVFRSDAPAGTSLVVGSVGVPAGAVVHQGNAPGDTSVVVGLGSLRPPLSRSLSFDVQVDAVLPAGQSQLTCQGTATSTFTATIPTDDPATGAVDDPTLTPLDFDPDLAVTKQPTSATVAAGALLVWDLDVGNLGRAGSGPVSLTETVPLHTSFSAADSAAGWSCTDGAGPGTACTLSLPPFGAGFTTSTEFAVRVDGALPAGAESTSNTATVTDDGSQGPDPVPGNNTATATAALDAAPALTVTKTGPSSARPGDTLAYQITYANTGTQEATGVELEETVPQHTTFAAAASNPGWSCADGAPAGTPCTLSRSSVAAGASATVAFAVRLATTVPADLTAVTNRVSIHRDPGDDPPDGPDPDDETDTPVDAAVDLRVTKTGPPSTGAGATVVYDLALANTGDRDAESVTVLETVPAPAVFDAAASSAGWDCADGAPAGTPCTLLLGDLPAGATANLTFAVRLPATIPAGLEALTNLSTVTSDSPDANPDDNDARATTPILAAPDLAVIKTDHDAVVQPGGALLYTLTVANLGEQDAANVALADTLPAGATFEARASTDGWSCNAATPQVCVFTLPALAAGAPPLELALAVSAAPNLPPDVTELVNLAAVSDDGTGGDDPEPDNNTATETTPVLRDDGPPPPPDHGALAATLTDNLLLDIDEDDLADSGDIVTYVALVESRGPADAHAVRLTIPLDPHTTLIPGSVTTTRGEVIGASGQVTDRLQVALGDLPVDTSATVTFEVDVGEIPPGTDHLSAQGTLTADNSAGTLTDDPDTPAPLDPTLTPVGDAAGPPPPRVEDIPTLAQWGLILLALGLTSLALRRLGPVEEGTP